MVVGELAEGIDLLVIGGGPGGYTAAVRAAQLGRDVVLVERNGGESGLGGVCLHVGCIPSKALIELAGARGVLRRLSSRGLVVGDPGVDLAAFQKDRTETVSRLARSIRRLLTGAGVRVVHGEARLTGPRRAVVRRDGEASIFFEFRDAVVAAGSRPAEPPTLPRDGSRVLDSTDALALRELPRSVAIVGGGAIGLELASAFHALGSRVSVVELADRVLSGMDAKISHVVQRSFKRRGIDVHCDARVVGDDGARLLVTGTGGERRLDVDAVVVAVGRKRNVEDLGLEAAGVAVLADGEVAVDGQRLAAPNIAAIGDLTEGPSLAHKAMAEALVAAEALSGRPSVFEPMAIPSVVYTDPEVAVAGLSEQAARRNGVDVAISTVPMSVSARGATMGHGEGIARILADRGSGVVMGLQLVGPHASELIAEGVLAIEMGATLEDLAHTIHAHPTLSEAVFESARLGYGAPLHGSM
ncbi:dihydrolipoyl dehydrogenase [Actinomadura sp. B10D3]|uniref:dihydrolipoyl dehydrogenase n=1 Tax=Actinomadura sp. B10D3 TaxID=3153557 RepID=UPI00325D6E5E